MVEGVVENDQPFNDRGKEFIFISGDAKKLPFARRDGVRLDYVVLLVVSIDRYTPISLK